LLVEALVMVLRVWTGLPSASVVVRLRAFQGQP
jgi:hypothetical protein